MGGILVRIGAVSEDAVLEGLSAQFVADLQFARSEAVRKNRPVVFKFGETSAEALIMISQLLAKPGIAWRTICGSTMRHSTRAGDMPKDCAASACPNGAT